MCGLSHNCAVVCQCYMLIWSNGVRPVSWQANDSFSIIHTSRAYLFYGYIHRFVLPQMCKHTKRTWFFFVRVLLLLFIAIHWCRWLLLSIVLVLMFDACVCVCVCLFSINNWSSSNGYKWKFTCSVGDQSSEAQYQLQSSISLRLCVFCWSTRVDSIQKIHRKTCIRFMLCCAFLLLLMIFNFSIEMFRSEMNVRRWGILHTSVPYDRIPTRGARSSYFRCVVINSAIGKVLSVTRFRMRWDGEAIT